MDGGKVVMQGKTIYLSGLSNNRTGYTLTIAGSVGTGQLGVSFFEPIQGIPSAEGKALWNQIRQAWLADIVEQATKEGVVNPRVYNNLLRTMGRPAFEEMFPEPVIRQSVDKIQDLFTLVGKAPPVGASLFSR